MGMFEWSKGSALRALVRAEIPGAAYDDGLGGWTHGIVQHRFKLWSPVEMLDIELGEGPRPHREMFAGQGARVEAVAAAELSSADELARRRRKYGLVTLLSLEREQCLEPLDLGRPLPSVELLLNASTLMQNGVV